MTNELELLSAFSLGLAGAGHCLGMCGGISAALNLGGRQTTSTTLSYHVGRLVSYAITGALVGVAAHSFEFAHWQTLLRYIAGLMLIAMGLYISNLWLGLTALERVGARIWQPIGKMSQRWIPVRSWRQALPLGLCWGLMPCGLIYSALAWAASAQSPLGSAMLMFTFGLGTLPAMLATSLGAHRLQELLRTKGLKMVIAFFLIASGIWTLYLTYSHNAPGANHDHHKMNHSSTSRDVSQAIAMIKLSKSNYLRTCS